MLRCRRMDRMLSYLADGELGEAERARVEEHLATCPRCREHFRAYQQTRSAVKQFEPVLYRKLSAGRHINTWAPGTPGRRPLLLAAAVMVLALGALVPFGARVCSEMQALPWHPGYVLSRLPAGFTAVPLTATRQSLVLSILGPSREPVATVAFLRGQRVSQQKLLHTYGWDRVSLVQLAGRRCYEAYKTVRETQGGRSRQVYLLTWNERGYCTMVRQASGGEYQDLAMLVRSLIPGDRRQMLRSLHEGPRRTVTRDSLLLAP